MNLQELQDLFYRCTISETGLGELGSLIRPGGKLDDPSAAMLIHKEGYFARLTEALGETYQAVWFVLGDEDFFACCSQYIAQQASMSYNLNLYGRDFPRLLKQSSHMEPLPFLAELADFELSFTDVFHAQESLGLEAQLVQQRCQENPNFRIRLAPSMQIKAYSYPILHLWKAAKAEEIPEDLNPKRELLCLYKTEDKVFTKTLNEADYLLLNKLRLGLSLEELLENDEVARLSPEDVQNFFQWLCVSGLVIDV